MRMPRKATNLIKMIAVLSLAAISIMMANSNTSVFNSHDKAFYADANAVTFVRPGLVVKILSGAIAGDGTITAKVRMTDPKGLPLDRDGVTTPGAVTISCTAAVLPHGQTRYTAYTTRVKTSTFPATAGKTATQAATDTPAGTWAQTADGEYVYTFRTKAPSGFDKTATHSIGCQASRNLTEFDLSTYYATDVFTFVPDGSKVTHVRDMIETASCNKCHDQLAFHGGSRRGIDYCILCHTPQTTNPETDNTVDLAVMVHRLHAGPVLPSVKAGGKYQIVGFGNAVSDWSDVTYPGDVKRCETCHDQGNGATQAANYLKPTRAGCGSCHDDVNFATGENHVDLPQVSDNQCATCHIPQGELEFDASIKGAHTIATRSTVAPGLVFTLVKVDNGTAGKSPTVTFTMKDSSGNPLNFAQVKATSLGRVALVLAGPTEPDYGYTKFTGPAYVTGGYISEDPSTTGTCDANGTCTYTFVHGIPADAKGTFTIGIEGRRGLVLLPGTKKEQTTEVGAINKVINFSVDGSSVAARRQVVSIDKCNGCHQFLSLHGENRNQIEMCVLCHNPSETDLPVKALATNPADKTTPLQAVDFKYMIHRIHTGEELAPQGVNGYVIVGFGGSHNDFGDVRYPAFSPSGAPGDRRNCAMCHVNGSENNLPTGRYASVNPQNPINPSPAITTACTGCHANISAASHALANTTTLGESCEACHGSSADFSVARVHAR
jgi:OmcA/MtrC family decaheme c-type cytochrome